MIGSPRNWREMPQRYRYEAARCEACGEIQFPPRMVCRKCGGRAFSATTLAQEGTLETFTVIRVAPSGFTDQAPYAVGVVKLDDGVKVTAQIVDTDVDRLETGRRVRMEFRKIVADGHTGVISYGYKFVPAG